MALKRYIGPLESVRLQVAGHEIGIVKQGDSIVVPDELAELTEWQADLWADGAPVAAAKSAKSAKADDGGKGEV